MRCPRLRLRSVAELSAEPLADSVDSLVEEIVDAGWDFPYHSVQAMGCTQKLEPVLEGIAGQESLVEQAKFRFAVPFLSREHRLSRQGERC